MTKTPILPKGFISIITRILVIGNVCIILGIHPTMQALVEAGRAAQIAEREADYFGAAEARHRLFAIQPWVEKHLIAAIEAEMQAGEYAQAKSDLLTISNRRALTAQELGWLGTVHAVQGSPDEAIAIWEQARTQGGLDIEALRTLADLYVERGEWQHASDVLAALAIAAPNDTEILRQLGLIQALDQPDKAAITLGQLVALNPDDAELLAPLRHNVEHRAEDSPDFVYAQLGTAYLELDPPQLTLADEALTRAVSYNPAYPDALALLSYVRVQLDRPSLGVANQAVALAPDQPFVLTLVGLTWKELDRPADARMYFERAYELDPTNAAICVEIASTHRAERGLDWAEIWMQEALRLNPGDPRFRVLLVQFYVDEDYKVEEVGLDLAKMLAADFPESAEAHDALAWAYYLVGDLDTAQNELDRAMTLDPGYARAFVHMGQLMEQRGEPSHAMWYYIRASELEPNGPYAAQARRAIERLGGR